jgi:tRNA(fMet)-specific endonuclease VapC
VFCLDTNIVIYAVNRRRPTAVERLDAALAVGIRLWISTVALFELEFGIAKSERTEQSAAVLSEFLASGIEVVPFDTEDARHAGAIRAHLERAGTPIGAYDILIAAHARRYGAALVTANASEFARVPGLIVEDWAT